MSEDNTKDLTEAEKLDLILSELANVKGRLSALEAQGQAQAEERANTTRPLLDRIIQEMIQTRDAITERLERIEAQLEVMTVDIMDVRTAQRRLGDRVSALEQRPN